ncbi:MAG: hypothetical protein U0670_11530 [Anaerolineae bacterium]
MQTLTLEYVLEGRQRGYQFTSATQGIPPELLKQVWRLAMPRGKSWSDPAYRAARSLKCFTLDETGRGLAAACEITGTDQVDEVGRTGIRRALIHLHTWDEHTAYLHARLASLPVDLVARAEKQLYSREWQLLFRKHRDRTRSNGPVKPQTVLAYPYTPQGWDFVEACLLLLVTRATLLTNLIELSPKINPFADRVLSFTTLALDPREAGRLVAIPAACAEDANAPVINLG